MNTQRKPGTGERAPEQEQDRTRSTPADDIQPQDAGTAESGNEPAPQRQGTAAEKAMKQASKTDAEAGERRR
ncbi:hypothetical protein [Ramlibacter sp.]|uniref:hypothetical protein n=1 Tax=Ramlibacter sp. TaxID=1917967 RepID=UPI002FC89E46